jgi:hypothetical protein
MGSMVVGDGGRNGKEVWKGRGWERGAGIHMVARPFRTGHRPDKTPVDVFATFGEGEGRHVALQDGHAGPKGLKVEAVEPFLSSERTCVASVSRAAKGGAYQRKPDSRWTLRPGTGTGPATLPCLHTLLPPSDLVRHSIQITLMLETTIEPPPPGQA